MESPVLLISEGEADFMVNPGDYGLEDLRLSEEQTPMGQLAPVVRGKVGDQEFVYLSHGGKCRSLPIVQGITASMWLARELGVQMVLSVTLVGGISRLLAVNDVVVCDDFIDMSTKRPRGLLETIDHRVSYHPLAGRPFCPELRRVLVKSARQAVPDVNVLGAGVYVNTEGPRYETAAEIRAMATLGGDVVGHTVVPAVTMAREIRACFAVACIVGNAAEGVVPVEPQPFLSTTDVSRVTADILIGGVRRIAAVRECDCGGDQWWASLPKVRKP